MFYSRNVTNHPDIRQFMADAIRYCRRVGRVRKGLFLRAEALCLTGAAALRWSAEASDSLHRAAEFLQEMSYQETHGLNPNRFYPASGDLYRAEEYLEYEFRRDRALDRLIPQEVQ